MILLLRQRRQLMTNDRHRVVSVARVVDEVRLCHVMIDRRQAGDVVHVDGRRCRRRRVRAVSVRGTPATDNIDIVDAHVCKHPRAVTIVKFQMAVNKEYLTI